MAQLLFLAAVLWWAALEIYLHVFRRAGRRGGGSAERLSKSVMLAAFAFAGFGARVLTPDFAPAFRLPFSPLRWAGTALLLVGVGLAFRHWLATPLYGRPYRAWARRTRRLVPFVL